MRMFCALLVLLWSAPLWASEPVQLDLAASELTEEAGQLTLQLTLDGPAPFKVAHLQSPPRIAIDLMQADLSDPAIPGLFDHPLVVDVAAGRINEVTSRLVLQFHKPVVLNRVQTEQTDDGLRLLFLLDRSDAQGLAARVLPAAGGDRAVDQPVQLARQDGKRPLRVMLDPGHGGIDPGALSGTLRESELMLGFAKELQLTLQGAGMQVALTRDTDTYVSLERRVALAQQGRADVMISLHADAAGNHSASGAKVYTISEEASDRLSKLLILRQERAALLAGIDLTAQDDAVADVLTDLARQNSLPRSKALADALVAGLAHSIDHLHPVPRSEANFSVLKSAEVPSVLLELGFLSNAGDLARLQDPDWRQRAQAGIAKALQDWAIQDAAGATR